MEIRKVYAPYSKSGEQVGQTPLEGYVEVNQAVYPAVNTGLINENGKWIGLKSSDEQFHNFAKDESIPNGQVILAPQSVTGKPPWVLDMTGFNKIQIAIKPTNGGNFAIEAIMGPDVFSYANLNPVNAAAGLRGNTSTNESESGLYTLFSDSSEAMTADVWNIFMINSDRLADQKLLQFKITNNSGGTSDIETAFMRVV